MNDWFHRVAERAAGVAGAPWAFLAALAVVLAWLISGPLFHFSDTWQLVINTGTTIITFLMVFLIQNAQNRDARAVHLKLDELIRSTREAHDSLMDVEHMSDAELARLQDAFRRMAEHRPGAGDLLRTIEEELEERSEH